MEGREKSVVRFNDGKVLKGYCRDFSAGREDVTFEEDGTGATRTISVGDLKAVFFVKSFEGNYQYKDKKRYGITKQKGQRVFIKFNDGESLLGFLEGGVPWKKGFFLSRRSGDLKGFFLYPSDDEGNNLKVFVVAAAVSDLTVVP